MSDQQDQHGRPLFACGKCSIVYARFDPPGECRVCGHDSFTEVQVQSRPF
ncbi:hypothetical protein [Halopelagius fulvigenes]|uniref:Rubrerythrin-like domain-containing protein n=1 Tax=Halopelagius fulvigenes TaxID=1198324 RepID=A0ABD5TZQ3_9EURY